MNNLKTPQFLGLAVPHAVRLRQRNHRIPALFAAARIDANGTYRTCPAKLTMSVDRSKADLALGRIGAFNFAPLVSPSVMRG